MPLPKGKHRKPWYQIDRPAGRERSSSARRQAQRRLRRRKRADVIKGLSKNVGLGALIVALVGGVAGGIYLLTRGDDGQPPQADPPPLVETAVDDTIDTTLLFGTKEDSPAGEEAVWLTLVSMDETSGRGSVIYIPAHTATEVPGHGLLGLGEALASGDVPLLLVSTENLLGLQIDRYLELSDSDARVLFEATGPLTVDVPVEVHLGAGENQTRLLLDEGEQTLPSKFLKNLLFTLGIEGDEAELGSRHLAFWEALFERFGPAPVELARAIEKAEAALVESDADVEELASFFQDFLKTPADDRALATLPVSQVSVGGDELYEVDNDELPDFMEDTLGSKPSLGEEVRVQILNGNGEPGIGEDVAAKLSKENFRVILSGNARSLDYETTLIVTYDSSEKGIATAERARELLGVGEVQVSAQGQGIVDLTIVVGEDFLRAE